MKLNGKIISSTKTYMEMSYEEEEAVHEYEMAYWRDVILSIFKEQGLKAAEEYIHDLWLDYQLCDKSEDALLKMVGSDLSIQIV